MAEHINKAKEIYSRLGLEWSDPESLTDALFDSTNLPLNEPDTAATRDVEEARNENDCVHGDKTKIAQQAPRPVKIHFGLILSSNMVIRDARARDSLNESFDGNALCIDFEAIGLPNDFPCVVIRGICDYADSHDTNTWQYYAAVVAAAAAKELLAQPGWGSIGAKETTTVTADITDKFNSTGHS
ncbi:unnamed protein product [Clonostachys byssicola]|uniref:Uncharacterized protein n=1 Tax=Clonostachys byssicola TaxID=160290 RepID=A0A9N9XYQ6_9HYPO|nr:unnamed protein product [Clonostachys byssicola]